VSLPSSPPPPGSPLNFYKWKARRPQCLSPDAFSWDITDLKPVSFSVICLLFCWLLSVLPDSVIFILFLLFVLAHISFYFTFYLFNLRPPSPRCISIRLVEVRAVTWSCVILSTAVNPALQMHDRPVNACCVENNFETFSCQTAQTCYRLSVTFAVCHLLDEKSHCSLLWVMCITPKAVYFNDEVNPPEALWVVD